MRRRLESDEKLSSGTFAGMRKMREINYHVSMLKTWGSEAAVNPQFVLASLSLSYFLFQILSQGPKSEACVMRRIRHSARQNS